MLGDAGRFRSLLLRKEGTLLFHVIAASVQATGRRQRTPGAVGVEAIRKALQRAGSAGLQDTGPSFASAPAATRGP
jgi:hypothetical protein